MAYQRPAFWRRPYLRRDPEDEPAAPRKYRTVTPGTPAGRELLRGDIIAKIDDYDARDLRHEDAQYLFKNAPKQIKLVVQRDAERDAGRNTPLVPRSPIPHSTASPYNLPRTPSPRPVGSWNGSGPESLRSAAPTPSIHESDHRAFMLSPTSTHTDDTIDESIHSQPYRTNPLVLPGAKVRREPGPTECYLRHHPNPAMRAPPHHDYRDTLMKQKVAESMLQRVIGEEGNKYAHKQFNSPINLYSEQNIANSIRQQTSPLPSKGHFVKSPKPLQYDPAQSETYRALQEEGLTGAVHEVPTPAQTKVYQPPANKRPVPILKQPKQTENNLSSGKQATFVNSLNEETIQQSHSFKRLMFNVLSDTEF